jgi:predicted lipid-binding transport protein (Tim44 family)
MANAQLLEIILLAAVAGVVLFRLYTILGRRTGGEHPPDYHVAGRETGEAVAIGDKTAVSQPAVVERPTDPVLSGLFDISLVDRDFDKDKFLSGARAAYEMIETAFAEGDCETLRPLLDADVYAAFESAIALRGKQRQRSVFTFVGYKEVKVATAAMNGYRAEIAVSFEAQCISAVLDTDGKVVEGDDKSVREVSDIWTFARDVRARDPNWMLVATAGKD